MSDSPPCVFLDTSFLVTLCDASRSEHDVAKRYFRFWVESGAKMIVSAIVYAEYIARADLPTIVLSSVSVAPFDAKSAMLAGRIMRQRLLERQSRPVEVSRDALKDDFKIIAHACECGAGIIVTDDAKTFPVFVQFAADRFREVRNLRLVLLGDGFNEGVARSGQPEFDLGIAPPASSGGK